MEKFLTSLTETVLSLFQWKNLRLAAELQVWYTVIGLVTWIAGLIIGVMLINVGADITTFLALLVLGAMPGLIPLATVLIGTLFGGVLGANPGDDVRVEKNAALFAEKIARFSMSLSLAGLVVFAIVYAIHESTGQDVNPLGAMTVLLFACGIGLVTLLEKSPPDWYYKFAKVVLAVAIGVFVFQFLFPEITKSIAEFLGKSETLSKDDLKKNPSSTVGTALFLIAAVFGLFHLVGSKGNTKVGVFTLVGLLAIYAYDLTKPVAEFTDAVAEKFDHSAGEVSKSLKASKREDELKAQWVRIIDDAEVKPDGSHIIDLTKGVYIIRAYGEIDNFNIDGTTGEEGFATMDAVGRLTYFDYDLAGRPTKSQKIPSHSHPIHRAIARAGERDIFFKCITMRFSVLEDVELVLTKNSTEKSLENSVGDFQIYLYELQSEVEDDELQKLKHGRCDTSDIV